MSRIKINPKKTQATVTIDAKWSTARRGRGLPTLITGTLMQLLGLDESDRAFKVKVTRRKDGRYRINRPYRGADYVRVEDTADLTKPFANMCDWGWRRITRMPLRNDQRFDVEITPC